MIKLLVLLCWCCDKLRLSPLLCIVVASWDCHCFCVVGVIIFLCLHNLDPKAHYVFFFGTLRGVVGHFTSPIVHMVRATRPSFALVDSS
jgi:hypothetical protein